MKNKNKYIFLPVLIALVIFYLCCLIPSNDIPEVDAGFPLDKLVHFLMYVGLAGASFLAYIRLRRGNQFSVVWASFYGILIPVIFGGLIEIIQSKYCPGRSGDWFDFLADSLGVLSTIPAAYLYKRNLDKKQNSGQ